MNIFKSFIFGGVIVSLVFSTSLSTVSAATLPAKVSSGGTNLVAIAEVNFRNAKIVSQNGNVLVLSFDLTNGKGLQTGVKYGVQLISQKGKTQYLIDEKVYDESLTLPENSSVSKEVTYTAPPTLTGEYTVILTSRNANGFPYTVAIPGTIKLAASIQGVTILSDTCTASTALKDSHGEILARVVDINPTDVLYLTCTAVNGRQTPVELTPYYQTTYRSAYGESIKATGGDTAPITFGPLEKKTFTLKLPKAEKPQVYNVNLILGAGDIVSNAVTARYSIRGANATIENLSMDKDYYVKGDVAQMSLIWSALTLPDVTLATTINVSDDRGYTCASSDKYALPKENTVPKTNIPVTFDTSCFNPHISVAIVDTNGSVLDQKSFVVQTKSVSRPYTTSAKTLLILIGVCILICIIYTRIKKNKKKDNSSINDATPTMLKIVLALFVVGCTFFSSHTASADSYAVAGSYNSSARITVTLDKTTYLSGEQIKVTASADTYTNVSTVSVTVSNGITSNNIIPQTSATVSSAAATLTAEAAPGTAYGVSVDATVAGVAVIGNPVVVQFGSWSSVTQTGDICGAPTKTVFVTPPATAVDTGVVLYYNKSLTLPVTDQVNVQDNVGYIIYSINNQGLVGAKKPPYC